MLLLKFNFFLLLFRFNNLCFLGVHCSCLFFVLFYLYFVLLVSVLVSAFDVTGFLKYIKYSKQSLAHTIYSINIR